MTVLPSCAGDWEAAQRREDAAPAAEDAEDVFGEFEDIETGACAYLPVCYTALPTHIQDTWTCKKVQILCL